MPETESMCAILRALVADHGYGRPTPRDVVLARSSYPAHQGGAAKEAYERVRRKSFVVDGGSQGIMLDFSDFGSLVQFLHDRCGWERFEPQLRIKHFEGWDEIEWKD